MKNFFSITLIALFAAAASAQPIGPNYPTAATLVGSTTTSGTSDSSTTQWCLASGTGIVTPSLSTSQAGSFLFADREAVQVTGAGVTTSCFRIKRGQLGTRAQPHANAVTVWIGNAATSTGDTSRPLSNTIFPMENASPPPLPTTQPAFGTTPSSAVPVSGTIYWSEIAVEHNRPVTGICMLNGSVAAGTDNHIFALYDYAGSLLGQTAATATSGASLLQCLPLVTPIEISGYRSYFIAFQSNGTTDTIQKYITGEVGLSFSAGSQTGVSGTIPATIAVPGTFTTAKGPIGALY